MNYLQGLKSRDKKESKLTTIKHQIEIHDEHKHRMKVYFEKELAAYQKWKQDNNIEGLIF